MDIQQLTQENPYQIKAVSRTLVNMTDYSRVNGVPTVSLDLKYLKRAFSFGTGLNHLVDLIGDILNFSPMTTGWFVPVKSNDKDAYYRNGRRLRITGLISHTLPSYLLTEIAEHLKMTLTLTEDHQHLTVTLRLTDNRKQGDAALFNECRYQIASKDAIKTMTSA